MTARKSKPFSNKYDSRSLQLFYSLLNTLSCNKIAHGSMHAEKSSKIA